MLVFLCETDTGELVEVTWRVGEVAPRDTEFDVEACLSVIADGIELAYIRGSMPNLPYREGQCTWRGDLAWFVWDNL